MQRNNQPEAMEIINQSLLAQTCETAVDQGIDTQAAGGLGLATLPTDVKRLVCARYLNGVDALNFFRAAPKSLKAVYPDIARRQDNPLRKLLSHGALGELEAAKKIWNEHPELLTYPSTIYHPNRSYVNGQAPQVIPFYQNPGRYQYNHTFYQILLMNSEFEEAEEVGKRMTLKEKQRQFNEVFPDGKIKKYQFDLEEAKKLLQAVWEAVAKDDSLEIACDNSLTVEGFKTSGATEEALYKLYSFAKPESKHAIGLVFDPAFYQEALKLYDENSHQFKNIGYRCQFWNIRVEEWLAGCLGTGFLRVHARGIGNVTSRAGCLSPNGFSYFSFRRPIRSIPGFHYFVGYYAHGEAWGNERSEATGSAFSKLMASKNQIGERLYASLFTQQSADMSRVLK